ncbi:YhgE/Pip domain-containing protein [Corynebacterium vitaeruminis]|uniref:ABC-2 type transporter transmembrane domain-containing protein n=1 Tax=Corynebacterium vitaeruminis DSM 20294 TaxID=1224164 RepID=W5YB76_9CORY|nr:YhgE/Pip domain-containing protein [Corynebacterium vitaeruminis]AHI23803.1 hypothetical protein B843_12135 [Corynebacterium vitaeruminis DSM 20294]
MSQQSLGWHRLLDWRPTSVLARIGIVLLLVAPISIAGTLMWAMWDPSKYMRDIKLAVVNEDAGVTSRGEYTNYGDQIVEGLLDTDYLSFTDTSADDAQEGLTRGKYMMVVTIPKVFSEEAVTIISDNPVRPTIKFATNDYYGTNSSVITASLVPKVQTSVENAITKKYADKVIAGFGKLSGGLNQAADGAGQLDEGAAKLQDGGAQAVDGIAKLDDGAGQLADGTTQLTGGIGELSQGANRLQDGAGQLSTGMDTLVGGTQQLADGAGQIQGGVTQLTDMLIPLLTQAQQVSPSLSQAEQILRQAGMTDQADQIHGIASKLDPANSENMVNQLGQLRDGTALLHDNLANPDSQYLGGVLKLQDGAHQLADGTTQLTAGIGRLSDGATALDSGAHQLADGTGQLRTGGDQLKDGLDQLKDGTGELSTKLSEGAASAPTITKPDVSAQNMAVPITFTSSNEHPVQTVVSETDPTAKKITGGVSMLLVLVFGSLIMLLISLLLPYYFGRGTRTGASITSAWLTKTGANTAALAILAVISRALGWHPVSWLAIVPVIIAMAATGAAVYQLLQVLFGRRAGGAVGLAFYALGIMVFGGVWPVAAIPSFLRAFHFVHPMTYAKMAFTRGTDGILDYSYWAPLAALAAFTAIALAISVAVLHARRVGAAQPMHGQEKVKVVSEGTFAPA